MIQGILMISAHADTDKPTIFDNTVPTVTLIMIGVVPAMMVLIIAVTTTIIIGQFIVRSIKKQKLEYKRELSNNSHREGEQLNELNHKEREHELDVNKEIQIQKLKLQHDERIQIECHQIDKDHEYRLVKECLKIFKELLLEDPNHTTENLKELMKFLNDDIIALLLDLSKKKRNQQINSIPPVSQTECDDDRRLETDGVDMVAGPAVVEETDFGPAPLLTNGTDVLDAEELEVMELLGNFIKSAQACLPTTAA